MENWAKKGYDYACQSMAAQKGANISEGYIGKICSAIQNLNDDINGFSGCNTRVSQLKGNIAELWHGDTFNIKAAVNDSKYNTVVSRSNNYASSDIDTSWGECYGLKYYKNAAASSDAQAISYFQKYCEYISKTGNKGLSFSDYLQEKGLKDNSILHDSIYVDQIRLIPADQYSAAVEYLKFRIAKESLVRPEQAKRYQETLEMLTIKIKAPDGTSSIELTREEAEKLAQIAKDGKFISTAYGFSTEELVQFHHVLQQGVKAGTSAAIISLVLKIAPEFYRLLEKMINEGTINESDFQRFGFAALNGASEGFIRGAVAGTLTTVCKSGMLGVGLKEINPGAIAALSVILLQSMKDSFLVVKGDLTNTEFVANLSKNVFVTSCGIGLGWLAQTLFPAISFAYMLGNFVGSFIGAFAYINADEALMSFSIYSGWTFFKVVEQNYVLPDEVMKEIGVDVFNYEKCYYEEYKFKEFNFYSFAHYTYTPQFIKLLRRGVIGVHRIGYL
ncbi:hypothetical protein KFX89_22475 [Bacteroides thetaiotaomicron]|uniref:hypothetical protein n=1 Tax=Bacteroides thetaiotaomicron TaxID=818 RepID=UPI001CE29359|nr:hypothetical protein [Bacteroides thetaiotaomicron]MCA6029503.1 hypothetical protein [Bacteroides thetaiotaomicron]